MESIQNQPKLTPTIDFKKRQKQHVFDVPTMGPFHLGTH